MMRRAVAGIFEQVPTIEEAMRFGFNLSKQKVYSKVKPLVVVLSEGEHVVEGSFTDPLGGEHQNTLGITCSNISFIGQSKDKTTVHGGFGGSNKKNVTVKSLTLTNPNGQWGIVVGGEEASLEMMGVSVKGCSNNGLYVGSGASVKATQCEFSVNGMDGVAVRRGSKGIFTDCSIHHNGRFGVVAQDEDALLELRGEQTEIHHNNKCGLLAGFNGTINIYIPSRSITALVHDNKRDLHTYNGAKIQSQLSSSSLELIVIHPVPPQ